MADANPNANAAAPANNGAAGAVPNIHNARLPIPILTGQGTPVEAANFVPMFEAFCVSAGITEPKDTIACLRHALQGPALEWLKLFQFERKKDGQDWQAVKAGLLTRFAPPLTQIQARRAEIAIKQRPGESVEEYFVRAKATAKNTLTSITAEIAGPSNAPGMLTNDHLEQIHLFYFKQRSLSLFVTGLLPALQDKVMANTSWQDIGNCVDIARHYETTSRDNNTNAAPKYAGVVAAATSRAKPRPRSTQRNRSSRQAPHPQQVRTHQNPISCYFCGGTYHTEKTCLAKKGTPISNIAAGPDSAQQQRDIAALQRQGQQLQQQLQQLQQPTPPTPMDPTFSYQDVQGILQQYGVPINTAGSPQAHF